MSDHLHHAESCIMLSTAVLNHMQEMTAAALRIYIYLSSRNLGQPVPVAVANIAVDNGLGKRSVISALKLLRDHSLIIRNQGKGAHCNSYCIPDVPLGPESALTISEPVSPTAEKQYTVQELVKFVYRPVTDQEFAELKRMEPDQTVLRKKLECLHRTGSVPRSFTFAHFVEVIKNVLY